jgi:hypothetical protein
LPSCWDSNFGGTWGRQLLALLERVSDLQIDGGRAQSTTEGASARL